MKKIVFILLACSTSFAFAQNATDLESIKLESAADCEAAEPYALQASSYLFTKPFEKNDLTRLKSLQFIIKWMSATPAYKFTLDGVAEKLLKGNDELLGLYMGAMTKYTLENKSSAGNFDVVKLNSITMLLNYCENPANNIKMTKNLKKLSEAKANGQLAQALQ
jgi:hypothetical protein